MNNNDIRAAIAALNEATMRLEDEYEMNGGEVTSETEEQEQYIESLKTLLEEDGVDSLGRWLKSKEDLVKTLKAEKASVDRQIKAAENTIDFIKTQVFFLLNAIGKDKVKGTYYSFAPAISRKTEVDKEILDQKYMPEINAIMEESMLCLPPWVQIKLSASVKLFDGSADDLPDEFKVVETPTCKFTKPRAPKEEK